MGTVEAMARYLQAFSELLPPTQQVRNPAFQEATPPPNGKSAQGAKARPPSLQAACEPRHKGSRLSRGSFQSLSSPLPTPQGFIFTSRDHGQQGQQESLPGPTCFFVFCFFQVLPLQAFHLKALGRKAAQMFFRLSPPGHRPAPAGPAQTPTLIALRAESGLPGVIPSAGL